MLRILLPIKIFTLLLAISLSQAALALHKPYIQTTASYVGSGDFQGTGGSLVFGAYHTDSHCFETEIGFVHLSADTLLSYTSKIHIYGPASPKTGKIPVLTFSRPFELRVHANIDEFPILLKYRFKHNFGYKGMNVYAGVGVGLNFMQSRYSTQVIQDKLAFCTPLGNCRVFPFKSPPDEQGNDWSIHPIGQIFAGISHNLTQQISFLIGAKLLFTNKYEVMSSEEVFGKLLQTRSLQKSIEVGLSYQF